MFSIYKIPEHDRPDLLRKLSSNYFFKDFSRQELTLLLECAQMIDFVPEDTIFKEGDIGVFFYAILKGEVEIKKEVSGKQLATLGPGKVFGEMAVLDNQPRSASAISRTATDLLAIEGRRLMEDFPHLSVKLLRNLARELSDKLRDANLQLDRF